MNSIHYSYIVIDLDSAIVLIFNVLDNMALPLLSQSEGEDYPANRQSSQDLDKTGRAHVETFLIGKSLLNCNRRSLTVFLFTRSC